MSKKAFFSLLLAAAVPIVAHAQRLPTASKSLDIQAGGSVVYGHSDYGTTVKGFGLYSTIDFKPHFGLMLDFHQADGHDKIYERTYEIGGRYVRHYKRLSPYAKGMIGRGVFNSAPPPDDPNGESSFNLAYNMFALGGGADYRLKSYLNLRGDFEYQFWQSGPGIVNGLTPYLGSVGVAYHFR